MGDRTGRSGADADVLLVEDNPGDVRLVREAFADAGASSTIHHAADGAEALAFVRRAEGFDDASRPDVVLLDLTLPQVDGKDVLAELAADPELRSIPVVVLTASGAAADVVEAYELGANAYLTKPVDPDEFAATIRAFEEFWLSRARLPPHPEECDDASPG